MADVSTHSTLPTSLVSYWELEEASGTRVDSHGSNDLTDINTVLQGTGKQGNCADFVGDDDYFTAADSASLDITGDISFSFWINPDNVTGDHWIIAKGDVAALTDVAYYVWTDGYLRFRFSDDGTLGSGDNISYYSGSSSTISTGSWQHCVITWDASTKTCLMYVNNSKETATGAGTATGIINSSADDLYVGARQSGGSISANDFNGLMDEVGIWSKVLTDSEVSDLYNAGDGIPYTAATSTSIKSICGVAHANIKSMAGVTEANTKSVAGVSNV